MHSTVRHERGGGGRAHMARRGCLNHTVCCTMRFSGHVIYQHSTHLFTRSLFRSTTSATREGCISPIQLPVPPFTLAQAGPCLTHRVGVEPLFVCFVFGPQFFRSQLKDSVFVGRLSRERGAQGECLPSVRPARYFSINYPDFSPRFTLSWRSLPSGPRCTAHLPYKARCKTKQYL